MIGQISWPVIGHNRWPISDEQCNFDPLLFCCKIKRRAQPWIHSIKFSLLNRSFYASLHNTSNQTRVDLKSSTTTACMWSKRYGKMVRFVGNVYAPQTVFLKTTNLLEVILVTIALLVSMHLRKHENFLKNETQNFTLGGFCLGGFLSWVVFVGGFCLGGGVVLEPLWPFEYMMVKTLNSNFLDWEETKIYTPLNITFTDHNFYLSEQNHYKIL